LDAFGVGVEEKFCGIATKPGCGSPWPVQSETIPLALMNPGKIAVPAKRCHLRKFTSCLASAIVKQAELNAIGHAGEQREVHAAFITSGAKRIWFAGSRSHTPLGCR